MRIDPIVTIAKREYLSRVKTKGFWIATLLLPLAMAALTILPSVIAMKTRASQRLAIVDEAGGFGEALAAKLVEDEKAAPLEAVEARRRQEAAQGGDGAVQGGDRRAHRRSRRAARRARQAGPGRRDRRLALDLARGAGEERGRVPRRERLELHDPEPPLRRRLGGGRRGAAQGGRHRRRRGRGADRTRSSSRRRVSSRRAAGRRAAWPASSSPTSSSSCSTW